MQFCTHVTIVSKFGREMARIQPPTLTLAPELIKFYAGVTFRNHWVTSDVRFKEGVTMPPFWVGFG